MDDYRLDVLKWDSLYFNVKSSKLTLLDDLSKTTFLEVVNKCKDFEFVTISNLGNSSNNNNLIGLYTPARLMDVNIQFEKKIEVSKNEFYDTFLKVENFVKLNEQILDIAKTAFKISRFTNDRRLSTSKAQLLYWEWTKNSFEKENKYFITYEVDNTIYGYLIFNIGKDNVTIELIAVSEKFQGLKVGTKLIQQLEKYVSTLSGINTINVGTQINNIYAINFYRNNDFKYISNSSVYHLWN